MFPGRVTLKAGNTVVDVAHLTGVLIVRICTVMLMTIYTAENSVVPRIGMTICTGIPFIPVPSGIDREILGIMDAEISRFPSRLICMTKQAILREPGRSMVGIAC